MFSDSITALILGIVEGLTEFLPISSTGHLILVGHLINFTGPRAETFEIFIQLGAILAVLILYFPRFKSLFDFSSSHSFSGLPGLIKLALACLPACATGFLLHKSIKLYLFSPVTVAIALILGGIVLVLVERFCSTKEEVKLESLTYRDSFLVGIFQCLALFPGVSRSGSMIVGGLILGFGKVVAAEFSFLVAVPMMFLATSYDLYKSRAQLNFEDIQLFSIGFIVSFLTAILAIKVFIGLLQKYSLAPYGYYRVALGILVLGLL